MQKPKHNNTTRPIPNIVRNPRRPPMVVNSFLENQHDFRRLKTLRGENSFSEVVNDHKGNENNIIVFSNNMANIDRNIKVELNSSIRSGRARFLNFPGATSGDLSHYRIQLWQREIMTQPWYTLVSMILLKMISRQKWNIWCQTRKKLW